MPPAPSYPSPNAAQVGQGTMPFYSNRQLTADELLSAELSRETSTTNLAEGSSNGVVHHGLPSTSGVPDVGRAPSPDQHHHQQQHLLQFTPSQQVGMDPNHDLSYGDQSARRKRSKISRACDECRRKKVCVLPIHALLTATATADAVNATGSLRCELRVWCRYLFELSSPRCGVSVQPCPDETRSQQRVNKKHIERAGDAAHRKRGADERVQLHQRTGRKTTHPRKSNAAADGRIGHPIPADERDVAAPRLPRLPVANRWWSCRSQANILGLRRVPERVFLPAFISTPWLAKCIWFVH